jgi:alcohol dehydrogenase class IV
VVGLGGGSNMDLAKMTATLLAHGGPPGRFVGDCIVPGPLVPLVCIPTTAGTGSEVTASAVLTDTERKLKVGVLSEYMRPALAIIDPRLTLSCPPKVTAGSGIDALTHAIEAYTAVENSHFPLPAGERSVYQGRNPIGDLFAEQAIVLAGKHLRRAVDEPKNLEAREGMALAATMAGLAFSNVGVALVHAMEYPVGGAVHVSHGAGNGLLLPFVMEFNLPERIQRMARVAELLGENVTGLTAKAAAERAIAAVRALSSAIGIPQRLSAIGVIADQLPAFAEKAITIKRIVRVNPRVPTQEDILNIYRAAL